MKKLVLLIPVFMLISITIKAQWNQSYTGLADSRNISIVDENIVWISDTYETIIAITTDGGVTWVNKDLPAAIAGNHGSLSAVSATTAYIIGSPGDANNGIYKTTDGGDTWVKQTTGFNVNSPYPDFVYFWDANNGVAVGDADPNPDFEIYTTTNGGDQWNAVDAANMPPGIGGFTWGDKADAYRVHGDTIYFLALTNTEVRILKSVNKGLNWTAISTPFVNDGTFDFNGAKGVFDVGGNTVDTIYSTADAGLNWTKTGNILTNCHGVSYLSNVHAYMGTLDGMSYSTDNGQNWTTHPSFENVRLYATEISPSGKIYMGGLNYVYTTTNYTGVNPSITTAKIVDLTNIDLTFSAGITKATAEDIANYMVYYYPADVLQMLTVQSVSLDAVDNSIVHLITTTSLPYDTITVAVKNVTGTDGFPVINSSLPASVSVIYYDPTGIKQVAIKSVRVYPNPASDLLTIDYGQNFGAMAGYTVTLTNALNQTLYTGHVNGQLTTVNLKGIAKKGLYFVRVLDASNKVVDTRKVVLQ